MTRPSRNQDQLLIETAKRLYPKLGASGMSLKMIADEADVNPGMFSYYFKTKSNFIRKVLESLREEVRKEVEVKVPEGISSLEKLRYILTVMGRTFRDQRRLALALYRDLLNQDPDVIAFLRENYKRQMLFLEPLIEQCQKEGLVDHRLSAHEIANFCTASVKTPVVISAALEGTASSSRSKARAVMTDEAIAQRVDMALRGIAPEQTAR